MQELFPHIDDAVAESL